MNRLMLGALAGAAIAIVGSAAAQHSRRDPPFAAAMREPDIRAATRSFLMYVIVPVWLAAGLADWACHRATRIEKTSGLKESLLHLLLLGEAGVPVLAALFFQVNAPILGLMLGALALHQATSLWDISYAVKHRPIPPIEQHVHTYLEMIPMMAVSFVSILHWPALLELFGRRGRRDMTIRLKDDPLPLPYVAATLGAVALLGLLPFAEELRRSYRASAQARTQVTKTP
jgi:hypothetical protein